MECVTLMGSNPFGSLPFPTLQQTNTVIGCPCKVVSDWFRGPESRPYWEQSRGKNPPLMVTLFLQFLLVLTAYMFVILCGNCEYNV